MSTYAFRSEPNMSAPDHLSRAQLNAISVIERVCSVFSLLGSVFVIVTFICSKSFHKPINRLVFYASFGNMMTNVGTLMSRQFLNSPLSAGCQLQAFLIQMFMPADAFWTLAMAINVYLTFYFKFDARRLRRMEIPYLICCYGIPLIPAFVYLFVKNSDGHRVYGNASLWCWVSSEWDIFRIATFYAPVWVAILITFFIYIRAGHTIYRKRQQLYNFSSTDRDPISSIGDALTTMKTTEVSVTSEVINKPNQIPLQPLGSRGVDSTGPQNSNGAYSVHISADQNSGDIADIVLPIQHPDPEAGPSRLRPGATRAADPARRRNRELNSAAWSYAKCALLFFTALLITWIPSSANRVYSVVHTKNSSVPLEFMSAFVLPLQGFWNAIIYMVTSWAACKNLLVDLKMGRRPDVTELVGGMTAEGIRQTHIPQFKNSRGKSTGETESMTELANSRSPSEDMRRSY